MDAFEGHEILQVQAMVKIQRRCFVLCEKVWQESEWVMIERRWRSARVGMFGPGVMSMKTTRRAATDWMSYRRRCNFDSEMSRPASQKVASRWEEAKVHVVSP